MIIQQNLKYSKIQLFYLQNIHSLIKMANNILIYHSYLPIDALDLVLELFNKLDYMHSKFDKNIVDFRFFFFQYAKYYMKNICRQYTTHKYKVMNDYLHIEEEILLEGKTTIFYPNTEEDLNEKILSDYELKIFNLIIKDNLNIKYISKILNEPVFQLRLKIKKIYSKLYGQ